MSKPISDTLRMLQEGAFNARVGDMFAGIVKAVDETGKPGKLTITIDVKKAAGSAALSVLADATDKTPVEKPDADLFWSTVEGNLTEQNPNQRKLDLQGVSTPPRALQTGS